MARNFGIPSRTAQLERTIDPRHEEMPHGDWPHLDVEPLEELDHDANRDILFGLSIGAGLVLLAAIALLLWLASMIFSWPAHAGDPTGYWRKEIAEGRAPPAEWWESLHAQGAAHGCCSDADGTRLDDVDWDTARDETSGEIHFRVRVLGAWRDVPPEAVVIEPNKYGPAVVWPVYSWDAHGIKEFSFIRCFLPGAGA
jgi:hypothetical protein